MSRVVELARGYLGTPFHHAGRVKGVGVDCSGLIVGVLNELGADTSSVPSSYERGDHFQEAQGLLATFANAVDDPEPGDILLFNSRAIHQHLAIVSERSSEQLTIIHAWDGVVRRTVEVPLDGRLARTPYSVWRLKI